MLIGIDTRPCSLSLRDRSMFNYEMTSKYIALKIVFIQKSIFVDIFSSFNPNRVMGINGGYLPAICRVCSLSKLSITVPVKDSITSIDIFFVLKTKLFPA